MTDYRLPINYLDTGRVARDKINVSFNEVVERVIWYRPHIENWIRWIWDTNTWVKAVWDSISMKVEDDYIRYKSSSVNERTQIIAIADLKWDPWEDWTDAWEYMTQAQYDALPDSKLTDWISRAIYDTAQHTYRTLLRATDNVLHYNNSDELYADLQFEEWLTPTSSFPTWVSIGNVSSTDGRPQSWVMINAKTNNWEYIRRLYWDDGKLYFDWGTGVFKTIATTDDITSALSSLRNELSTVALTWNSSDLNNDAEFTADKVMTMEEYEQLPWTAWDDKNYWIFEEEN